MTTWSVEFEKVATGLPGAEGPVFTRNGRFFMVAPFRENEKNEANGDVVAVDLDAGKWERLCAPSFEGCGGIPAGLQSDKFNDLWVADMRHGILKIDTQTGKCKQVARMDSDGQEMQGCNDCIFDHDGTLWVTAPAGPIAPAPYTRSEKEAFGSVYSLTPDQKLTKVDTGYVFSNGIAVRHSSVDGRPQTLIVAETAKKMLHALDITGLGVVGNKRPWAKLPGDHEGGPDGMDFDAEGRLLVANWGGGHVEVFGPEGGDPIERIPCPFQKPSNLHFRPGSTQVFVTEHDSDSLWKFNWKCQGAKHYCEI